MENIDMKKNHKIAFKNIKAFTLLELLVVIALLGLISVMSVQVFMSEDNQDRFDSTIKRIDEIKKAVCGRKAGAESVYSDVEGYFADMGVFPELRKPDELDCDGKYKRDDSGSGQPLGLWTSDIDGISGNDLKEWRFYKTFPGRVNAGSTEHYRCVCSHRSEAVNHPVTGSEKDKYWIKEEGYFPVAWELDNDYFPGVQFWAGWRGPYIEEPVDNKLKDGWGNPFLFVRGDLVKDAGDVVYRCIKNYKSVSGDTPSGLPAVWEEVSVIDPVEVKLFDDGGVSYYSQTYNIVSQGADGKPGGDEYDEDILAVISINQLTGAIAGRIIDDSTNSQIDITPYPYVYAYFVFEGKDAWCRTQADNEGYFLFENKAVMADTYTSCDNASLIDNDGSIPELNRDIPSGLIQIFVWHDNDGTAGDFFLENDEKTARQVFQIKQGGNWLGNIRIK